VLDDEFMGRFFQKMEVFSQDLSLCVVLICSVLCNRNFSKDLNCYFVLLNLV